MPEKKSNTPFFSSQLAILISELVSYSTSAPASSHDLNGLLLFTFAFKLHFLVSGFAHEFSISFFALTFWSLLIYFCLALGSSIHYIMNT
jgi:hypothetical protein